MTSDLMNMHEAAYCRDLLRAEDRDFFFLSLFAKGPARAALWALFTFHYEIRKAARSGREPTLRLIRLQWWEDALTALPDHPPPQNEILPLLKIVMANYTIKPEALIAVIEAYRAEIENSARVGGKEADLRPLIEAFTRGGRAPRAYTRYCDLKSKYGARLVPFLELRVALACLF